MPGNTSRPSSNGHPPGELRAALRTLQLKRIPPVKGTAAVDANEVAAVRIVTDVSWSSISKCHADRQESGSNNSVGESGEAAAVASSSPSSSSWHFTRSTFSASSRREEQRRNERTTNPLDSPRRVSEGTASKIADRLFATQTEGQKPAVPQPPPCIAATRILRNDFTSRHPGSAPPRASIHDEAYINHFFRDAHRRKVEAASARDKQDLAAHDKMHHMTDKGVKLDPSDTDALVRRLKEDWALHREQAHKKLTEKYVDRIRKRGCPRPPGRRHRQHSGRAVPQGSSNATIIEHHSEDTSGSQPSPPK